MSIDLPLIASAEEEVYLALQGGTSASRPAMTLTEVVSITGIEPEAVQRACHRLADAGLIAIDGVSLSPLGDRS